MTDLQRPAHLTPSTPFTPFTPSAPTPAPVDTTEGLAPLLGLLAGFFAAPPESATVATLRRGAGADLLATTAAAGDLGDAAAAFTAGLAGDESDEDLARRLGRAFGLLFLGIGGPATVAPYESFHRCGGRLFQAPVGEMDRLLAEHDLSVALTGEPSDHLSIETALLAHLAATGHPDRIAVAERLALWVPGFRDDLEVLDGTGCYAGAARLLAAAIDRAHRI